MHKVLREFLHTFVLVYIDDILVYSRSMAEHRHQVCRGPEMPERIPPVPQSEKVLFPPSLSALPWIQHQLQWYPDGQGEDNSN